MSKIKTKDVALVTIKTIDKSVVGLKKVKNITINTKNNVEKTFSNDGVNSNDYATKNLENSSNKIFDKNINIITTKGKKAIIEYNNFKIIDNQKHFNYEYEFTDFIELPNKKVICVDNETKLTSNFVIHLNSEEIQLPFIVRTRKAGDSMHVKNMKGRKKINDIFIDSKVPNSNRDEYPIVADSTGEIIWIPGIKKSHFDRKKEGKYDIILKYN